MLTRQLWLSFRLLAALRHWIRRHFTNAGLFILGVLCCAAILGIDTRQSLTFQIFAIVLAFVLLAIISGWFFHIRFTAQRQLPRFATVDEPLVYRMVIHNHCARDYSRLSVVENLQDPRPDFKTFCTQQEPLNASQNAFDRFFRYPRWQWLIQQRIDAIASPQALPNLLANSPINITLKLTPLRRGKIKFTGIALLCTDWLGIYRAAVNITQTESLLVLPKRYKMPPLPLPGIQRYHRGDNALMGSVGDMAEFVELRDYQPSDSLRHIHWKSWAKTSTPMVKVYQEEYFTRHALVLDTFASTEYHQQFEEAVSVAASFIGTVELQTAMLELMFVGEKAYRFTAGQGARHADTMLEILAAVNLCQNKPFNGLTNLILSHMDILSSCICILLDWDTQRKHCIEQLQQFNIPVWVFIIKQPGQSLQLPPPTTPNLHVLETNNIAAGLAQL